MSIEITNNRSFYKAYDFTYRFHRVITRYDHNPLATWSGEGKGHAPRGGGGGGGRPTHAKFWARAPERA